MRGMDVRFLGSGDTFGSGGRLHTCIHVCSEETTFLIDCGAEAYFFEKKIPYHLDYRTLMDHRSELGCRRLILTHMSEDMLRRLGGIEAEWAEDGKSLTL